MKFLILSGAIVLFAVVGNAAGKNEAYRICESMDFDNNKTACTESLTNFYYFDVQAISVCIGMDFDNGKVACVRSIGNKHYEAYEITSCASKSFDNQKNDCLRSLGQLVNTPEYPAPNYGCTDKGQLLQELRRVDQLLSHNDIGRARQVIRNLATNIQNCR
jgi:hypothetical protein